MAGDSKSTFAGNAWARELEKQEHCDVMFIIDGQIIGAHKILFRVMQARCEVLHKMATRWNHGDEPISIDDMEFEAFKMLLRYVYTCEILITNENVFTFLSAAAQFEMHHLEQLCFAHISKLLCTPNVCHFMNAAIDFKSAALQAKCSKMFSRQTHDILWDSSFVDLHQPALSALLDVETTNAIEIEIFYAVHGWMEKKCVDQHVPADGNNMRKAIGDALYKIRFPTMNAQEFANAVTTKKGFLTENEIAQTFQKMMVFDNEEIECPFPDTFRCQISHFSQPFDDMFRLFDAKIFEINSTSYDVRSRLDQIADKENDGKIIAQSLRIVMQCCADLANSYALCHRATSSNQNTRSQLLEEFDTWKDICQTKNFHDTMTKYMEFRTKLDEICDWE